MGPTSEKVKEIFSHGMMMLNIGSLTERRNSEPKVGITEEKSKSGAKKLPSPLEKTLTYLAVEDDNSDTDSLSRYNWIHLMNPIHTKIISFSVDMLNEDQISSLMMDKDIGAVCEEVLGTPIAEVISLPQLASSHTKTN